MLQNLLFYLFLSLQINDIKYIDRIVQSSLTLPQDILILLS